MKKGGFSPEKREKSAEYSSLKFADDPDLEKLRDVLETVKKRYHISNSEVLNMINDDILIPCTIFSKDLSPLENVVKFMKENLGLDYSEIAKKTGRNSKTVWQAYKNSLKKHPAILHPEDTRYSVPVKNFDSDLSILEAAVEHLKARFDISFHKIGELLQRNERTIWTVHNRARKKQEKEEDGKKR